MQNPLRAFGLWLAGERKSRTTGETIPRWQLGRPYRPPTPVITTEEAVRHGYTRASIVYACIRLIADAATSAPLIVYDRTGDEYQALPDAPLQLLLNKPNTKLTRRRMYLRAIQHLMLTGNAIWFKVRVPKSGPPTQLWPINPDLVTPIPDEKNYIAYYELALVDGTKARIDARDVIHLQLENPETPWWGVGPLQAAMQDANLYLGNKAWNLRTVERGAVTPGVLEVPEDLTIEQWEKIRAQLDERTFGNDDAGREMILGSGMKYHRMSLTGEELGYLESMRFGREEIAMVFGVPPAMLTPDNATLANVEAYNRQFWENTIVPLNIDISDILTQTLVPDYDATGRLVIDHDYSVVPAMQASLGEQSQVAERLVRTGFTPAGVNRILDLGFEDDEIRTAPTPTDLLSTAGSPVPSEERHRLTPGRTKALPGLDAFWEAADRERQAWEDEVAARVLKTLQAEGEAVTAAWSETESLGAALVAHREHIPAWQALLEAVDLEAARHFARREYNRLAPKARKAFDPLEIAIEWATRNAARKVAQISATTEEGIRRVITEGLTPGPDGFRMTTDQIAKLLKERFGITDDLEHVFGDRHYRIARTELGMAMNYGHDQGARQAAAEYDLVMDKGWSTSLDDRVRDSHAALHGEVVPMDQPFSNGLMYPGDPSGSAEEVVMCRCVLYHEIRY